MNQKLKANTGCRVCEYCGCTFFYAHPSTICNDCRKEYERVYMKTYHNIHNTKEVRVDKIEAMKKKYATVNIDDEIDKWFFGDNSEGAENA